MPNPGAYIVDDSSGAVTLKGISGVTAGVSVRLVTATLTNDVRIESMSLEYDVDVQGGTANISIDDVRAKGRLYAPTSAGNVLVSNSELGHIYVRNFNDLTIENVDLIEAGWFRGHINAQYGQNVSIDGGNWNNGTGNGIYLLDVNDVSIKNVSVSARQYSGVYLRNTQNVDLENVVATGNGGNGVYVNIAGDVSLQNVVATGNGTNGVNIVTAADVSLQTIEASENPYFGIFTRYAGAVTAAALTANGNVGQSFSDGALFWDVSSFALDGGEFSDNGRNGLSIDRPTSPVSIAGVSSHNNAQRGLQVNANGQAVAVVEGSLTGNGLRGIALYSPNGVTISDVDVSNNGSTNLVANNSDGGGIRIGTTYTNPIVIDNATVVGNTSLVTGAGISINTNGTATVSNSLIQGNSNQFGQSNGGGIYFGDSDGTHAVLDSIVENNRSLNGGGIWAWGNLAVERSTIAKNTAITSGGGVWAFSYGSLLVSQSTLSDNSAGSGGGGIRLGVSDAHITNSTISGNSTSGVGGGIYVQYGQPILDWNTIVNNVAADNGGGVYVAAGRPQAAANIIAKNLSSVGPDYNGSVSNSNGFATGGNVIGDGSDSSGFGLNDQVGTSTNPIDPLIGPLQNNGGPTQTHALLPGSPAIDITGDAWIEVDQRGIGRPVDGDRDGDPLSIVDAGAFEYENTAPSAQNDAVTTDEDVAVTIAVLANDSDPDSDPLHVTIVTAPANGSAVINLDGTVTFTPIANYHGSDSFSYAIDDGNGGTATATVQIAISAVNDNPEAVDAVFTLEENSPNGTEIGIIDANDVDGDVLSYALLGADAAAFAIDSTGRISVAEAALLDFETQSQFDFVVEVTDGNGGHATASVTIGLTDVLEVVIDVLPDDPDNEINLRDKEVEVAILGSASFAPLTMVDLDTVRLSASGSSSGAGIASRGKKGFKIELRDVNGDGILDLVMKFKTSEIGAQAGDTSVQLTGSLLPAHGGGTFLVEQDVTVVRDRKGGGKGNNK